MRTSALVANSIQDMARFWLYDVNAQREVISSLIGGDKTENLFALCPAKCRIMGEGHNSTVYHVAVIDKYGTIVEW
jgi:hypothetical protein